MDTKTTKKGFNPFGNNNTSEQMETFTQIENNEYSLEKKNIDTKEIPNNNQIKRFSFQFSKKITDKTNTKPFVLDKDIDDNDADIIFSNNIKIETVTIPVPVIKKSFSFNKNKSITENNKTKKFFFGKDSLKNINDEEQIKLIEENEIINNSSLKENINKEELLVKEKLLTKEESTQSNLEKILPAKKLFSFNKDKLNSDKNTQKFSFGKKSLANINDEEQINSLQEQELNKNEHINSSISLEQNNIADSISEEEAKVMGISKNKFQRVKAIDEKEDIHITSITKPVESLQLEEIEEHNIISSYNYDGINVHDLEQTGIMTIEALKSASNKSEQQETLVKKETNNLDEPVIKLTKEEISLQNKAKFKVLKEKVNMIRLKEIFELIGASGREDKLKNKWKMPWGDNVSLKGQGWYNHNRGGKGPMSGAGGAISFVQYMIASEEHLDIITDEQTKNIVFKRAVRWLAEQFGEVADDSEILATANDMKREGKKVYIAPIKLDDKHLEWVIKYLNEERNIPNWLIDKQILEGNLYAGVPDFVEDFKLKKLNLSKENYPHAATYCIFSTKYTAECRCIDDNGFDGSGTKALATGSEKNLFGFTVLPSKKMENVVITLVESSIDALSYHALYPDQVCISTAGVDNTILATNIAKESLENGWQLNLSYDNDNAGNASSIIFKEELIKMIGNEKYQEYVINEQLIRTKPPKEKDWNEYLVKHISQEELEIIYKEKISIPKKSTKKTKN